MSSQFVCLRWPTVLIFGMIAFFFCPPFVAVGIQIRDETKSEPALFQIVKPEDQLIPQYLLPAIHAAEVQADLGLSEAQLEKLEAILKELDRRWWPARILERSIQRSTVFELESELLQKMVAEFSNETVQRLQQLELQAQWPRMMLRVDVAEKIGLSAETQEKLLELAKGAEKQLEEIADSLKSNSQQDFSSQISAIRKAENDSAFTLLDDTQKQILHDVLGKRLDVSSMERIYPFAPELIASDEWAGNAATLNSFRGKVVLVHFYAFQCINCRNNFDRYNEWAENFKDQDVAIIGIQTPETQSEFNPVLVREAAEKDGLRFPVLIDLKSENWKAWGNTMWPTVYVVDKRGYIRYWWQGELNWQGATGDQKIAEVVSKLLKE